MRHTWYLSVDMQFYILSPLFLTLLIRFKRAVAYIIMSTLVVITTIYLIPIFFFYEIITYVISHSYLYFFKHQTFCRHTKKYVEMYYVTTHSRFPPWLLGIIFGVFTNDFQKNRESNILKSQVTTLFFALQFF